MAKVQMFPQLWTTYPPDCAGSGYSIGWSDVNGVDINTGSGDSWHGYAGTLPINATKAKEMAVDIDIAITTNSNESGGISKHAITLMFGGNGRVSWSSSDSHYDGTPAPNQLLIDSVPVWSDYAYDTSFHKWRLVFSHGVLYVWRDGGFLLKTPFVVKSLLDSLYIRKQQYSTYAVPPCNIKSLNLTTKPRIPPRSLLVTPTIQQSLGVR